MLHTTRTLLLVRFALLTAACGGSPETYTPEDEMEAVVDNEAALESATSCPGLELSVLDRSTGAMSTVNLSAGEVAASLTDVDLLCQPVDDQVHVFARGSEWVVFGADGQARWIPVIGTRYSGSTAVIQYVDPDDGISVHTAYVGCEAPPTVTASALSFESHTTTADSSRISGNLVQDERGATVWELRCDFYAPAAELYVSRRLPPILVPGEGPYFPDVDAPDLACAPANQCVENTDCGTGYECWNECCHVVIR